MLLLLQILIWQVSGSWLHVNNFCHSFLLLETGPKVQNNSVWCFWTSYCSFYWVSREECQSYHILTDYHHRMIWNVLICPLWYGIWYSVQPSQYINTLLVPKDGEIPLDIQHLASQGIFDVVFMVIIIILIGIIVVYFAW